MGEPTDQNTRTVVERLLESVSRGDTEALRSLSDESITIHTARGDLVGPDAAAEWVSKRFDHLDRRYRLIDLEVSEGGVKVLAALEYVWRESGEVADTTEVEIAVGLKDGSITSWRVLEDQG